MSFYHPGLNKIQPQEENSAKELEPVANETGYEFLQLNQIATEGVPSHITPPHSRSLGSYERSAPITGPYKPSSDSGGVLDGWNLRGLKTRQKVLEGFSKNFLTKITKEGRTAYYITTTYLESRDFPLTPRSANGHFDDFHKALLEHLAGSRQYNRK